MAYTSKWEQLSEATARVMAARGLSEAEARAEICSAMADGVINFRAKLLEHWSKPISSGAVLGREGFEMMNEIHPEDFDWRESRPIKPWIVRQGRHNPSGLWKLKWIELAKAEPTDDSHWVEQDSNLRRQCHQIYSLAPLAAWVSTRSRGKGTPRPRLASPARDPSRSRAGGESRTHNPRFTKPMLCRLSYASKSVSIRSRH